MDTIYLDNNATTPISPAVADAMRACHAQGFANPASQHAAGRRARAVLEDARETVAGILEAEVATAKPDRLIFTSGGTESNNLALRGIGGRQPPGRIVISAIEHPSILETAEQLERQGWQIDRLGVDGDGVVRVDELKALLTTDTRLVSVMLGNNETGVLQPVREIAKICSAAGVPMHTDATQAVGKLRVSFRDLEVDALSFTAHKFHGPRGIGVLLLRHRVSIDPILLGGFQQAGIRPGTEPIAPAVGLVTALDRWQRDPDGCESELAELRDRLESRLLAGAPELVINGLGAPRLPHTSNISFPGLDRQALMMALDLAGVACSTGSACASGSSEPSAVLTAMGLDEGRIRGALRFSVGRHNTPAEVDKAARRILLAVKNLRRQESGVNLPPPPPAEPRKAV